MDIISHWFNSIKENGWIPREQMRGKEAESNLDWNLVEEPKAGNPPSFMFVLDFLLGKAIKEQDQRIVNVMINLKPRIEIWF
jgi:mannosyl-oligosaccharide glucosidase